VTLDDLYKNFDVFAEAPNGVAQLRDMIMNLAISGRLALQDPDDEPAHVLIQRIAIERDKAGIIRGGRNSRTTHFSRVEVKMPRLPAGWEWTNLANIGKINPRNYIEDDVEASFIPMTLIPKVYGEEIKQEKTVVEQYSKRIYPCS